MKRRTDIFDPPTLRDCTNVVEDWQKDWWKLPVCFLFMIIVYLFIIMMCILLAVDYLLRKPKAVKDYIYWKLHPPPPRMFRCRIAKRGDVPQRLEERVRALTLEFPCDEEINGGIQLETKQDGEGDHQAGQQQTQENSHESKQKEEQTRQRTYLQHESRLFRKLFPELRHLVYRAVLLPPEITELRIARTRGRLCSYTYGRDMDESNSVSDDDGEAPEERSPDDEKKQ